MAVQLERDHAAKAGHLAFGERVLGVLTVAYLTPHTFTEAELRVLGLLASQAAIAIENAYLFTLGANPQNPAT